MNKIIKTLGLVGILALVPALQAQANPHLHGSITFGGHHGSAITIYVNGRPQQSCRLHPNQPYGHQHKRKVRKMKRKTRKMRKMRKIRKMHRREHRHYRRYHLHYRYHQHNNNCGYGCY